MGTKLAGVYRNSAGDTVGLGTITVHDAGTSTLATIYSDAALATATTNPFTGDADGRFRFFVAPGAYKITASKTGFDSWTEDYIVAAGLPLYFNVRDYGAVGDGATSDSVAVQAAIDAAEAVGGGVWFPPGKYLVSNLTADRVTLAGPVVSNRDGVPYGATGAVLHITDTVNPMITISGGVTFDGLSVFYPNQDGVAVTPVVYPPTIQCSSTANVTSLRILNCKFINPYRAIVSDTVKVMGRCHVSNVEAYAVKSFIEVYKSPEIIHFTDVMITTGVYGGVANTGNRYLGIWTGENGEAVVLDGHSDGFNWSQGIVHGYNIAFSIKDTLATGFQAQLGTITNVLFESQHAVKVTNPGALSDYEFIGCGFGPLNLEDDTDADASSFDWQSTGSGVSVVFSGCNFKLSNGKHVSITSTGLQHVIFTGCNFNNWARATGLATATPAIYANDAGLSITISGCSFRGQASAVDPAIEFDAVSTAVVDGCTFIDTAGPILIDGAGKYVITGCRDVGTTGSAKGIAVSNWTNVDLRGTGNNCWLNLADFPTFSIAHVFGAIAAGATSALVIAPATWGAINNLSISIRSRIIVGIPDLTALTCEGLVFQAYWSTGPVVRLVAHNPTTGSLTAGAVTYQLTTVSRD